MYGGPSGEIKQNERSRVSKTEQTWKNVDRLTFGEQLPGVRGMKRFMEKFSFYKWRKINKPNKTLSIMKMKVEESNNRGNMKETKPIFVYEGITCTKNTIIEMTKSK